MLDCKSYATLIQEFFVVPPEGAVKFLPWCSIAERVPKDQPVEWADPTGLWDQSLPIYKNDLLPPGILK